MKIFAVTDRTLAGETFLSRIEAIAASGVDGIILREKDLGEEDFRILAILVKQSCDRHGVRLLINSFVDIAKEIGAEMQLPLDVLRSRHKDLEGYVYGASIHSLEDLEESTSLGVQWVVFGNVFETSCKPGKAAAGTELLSEICEKSPVPVYGIGGITADNIASVCNAGASGVCIRSGYMQCPDPSAFTASLKQ